jgi:hypothetical protein
MMPYQFVILRYRHSASAGELVNVGLVLWEPDRRLLLAKVNERYGRLSKFILGFDGIGYRSMLRDLQGRFREVAQAVQQGDLLRTAPESLAEVLELIQPDDDGCFQWSHVMAGIHEAPQIRLDELFAELVTRHDGRGERVRRDEAEIGGHLDFRLLQTGLHERVTRDIPISTEDYSYRFHAGWRNGRLQVLEPISLDYINAADMLDKANVWSGRLYTLSRHNDFRLTGVVAPPQDRALGGAFEHAVSILRQAPQVRRIVAEEEMEDVLEEIRTDLDPQ